jgi:SAM-dependent methyltransferase
VQQDPEKEEKRLIQRCFPTEVGNALEVGCGNGRMTTDLARIANNLVATDPDVEELRSARRRVEIPVKFVTAFGESLPIAPNSMDLVAFTRSLHHQEPHKALSEAQRVLREGGQIFIIEPMGASLFERLFAVFDDESSKFKLAEEAIDKSGLKVFRSGSIRTWWVFEDFTEMAAYLFDYFGLELDREKENSMAQILGDRRGLEPLPIDYITRFWVLREW